MTTRTVEVRDTTEKTMAKILAPFHEAIQMSGLTEEEAICVFDEALREVRAERKSRAANGTATQRRR